MADWSNLPQELATKVAEHIDWYEDFESFGCVCSRWRSAIKQAKFSACVINNKVSWVSSSSSSPSLSLRDKHRLPWLMLSEWNENSLQRRFYSLSKRMVRYIDLPCPLEKEDHRNVVRMKLLSSYGWLLMVTAGKFRDKFSLVLINPLSGATMKLPNNLFQYSLYKYRANSVIKFILSANPSTTSDFTVFLCLDDPYAHNNRNKPAYWRNGDEEWSMVQQGGHPWDDFCEDIAFYRGNFYGVYSSGYVVKFGVTQDSPNKVFSLVGEGQGHNLESESFVRQYYGVKYLVESDDRLLIVQRTKKITDNTTTCFDVFQFDVESGEIKEVRSLGGRSVFVGTNSSFSLDATRAQGFKRNCIYYTRDYKERGWQVDVIGNGVYSLEDGKIESYYSGSKLEPFEHIPRSSFITWVESSS